MAVGLVRRSRAALVAAIYPDSLSATLSSLKAAGLIEGYEERPREVLIWGETLAIETRLHVTSLVPVEARTPVDRRAEYFRRCRQYLHTASFHKLPAQNRAIFRMHANGSSVSAIALKLGLSRGKVWNAIRFARLAADLPGTVSTMPRGPAPRLAPCADAECQNLAESRGFCHSHYMRWRRRRRMA